MARFESQLLSRVQQCVQVSVSSETLQLLTSEQVWRQHIKFVTVYCRRVEDPEKRKIFVKTEVNNKEILLPKRFLCEFSPLLQQQIYFVQYLY